MDYLHSKYNRYCIIKSDFQLDKIYKIYDDFIYSLDYSKYKSNNIKELPELLIIKIIQNLTITEDESYKLIVENNKIMLKIANLNTTTKNPNLFTDYMIELDKNCFKLMETTYTSCIYVGLLCIIYIWLEKKNPDNQDYIMEKIKTKNSAIFNHSLLDDGKIRMEKYKNMLLSTNILEDKFELSSKYINSDNINRFEKKINKKVQKFKMDNIILIKNILYKFAPFINYPQDDDIFWNQFIILCDEIGSCWFTIATLKKAYDIKKIMISYYSDNNKEIKENNDFEDILDSCEIIENKCFDYMERLLGNII